ncbi:MAG: M15 family metallopeptidase [Oscillospiraceae bacterium]|nr:M15 family metallopeptidase [Oscillospiraceae bacterium]
MKFKALLITSLCAVVVLLGVLVVLLAQALAADSSSSDETAPPPITEPSSSIAAVSEPPAPPRRGSHAAIPPEVRASMKGISMPEGATVSYDDLEYLTVYYHDFNYEHSEGHIIVARELAEEVLDIFAELYDIRYPIESVKLIDEFDGMKTKELDTLDRASMGNNNTSAFCYRMTGYGTLSQHSYGRAIDLNPKINPYITSNGNVSPANAKQYVSRDGTSFSEIEQAAMVHKDDAVYNIFIAHGWKWGGDWKGEKDYQHFEKRIN